MSFIFEPFENNEVYDATHIKETNPDLFRGKNKAIISIIKSHNIPQEQYIFASILKNVYKRLPYDSIYKSKRILIKKDWVDKNIPGFATEIVKKPDYPLLPPIIELPDEKKLKDKNGESISMVVCGEFHIDKIFFRAKDVATMLELKQLSTMLSDKYVGSFTENVHFVKFDISNAKFNDNQVIKNPVALYLTYHGLMRILFVTRSEYSLTFQKWALNILFTHQFGSKDKKIELANDLLETTNIPAIKAFLKTDVNCLPAVYLFELGKAKDLREIFNIPAIHDDETIIYKYGLTTDLARRTSEHASKFKKLGIKINLKHHTIIDCAYLQKAENEIKRYFTNMKYSINNPDYTEIVAIPTSYTPQLVVDFKQLCERYNGKLTEIKIQMSRLEDKIESLNNLLQTKEAAFNMILKKSEQCLENSEKSLENSEKQFKIILDSKDETIAILKMKM